MLVNKSILTCFAVSMLLACGILVSCASEEFIQPQSTASDNTTRELAPYFKRPTSAELPPDANGFIQRWLLLEPIPQSIRSNRQLTDSFVQGAIKKEYFPDQFIIVPKDGDKVSVGETEFIWHAVDASRYDVNLYSFARALGKPTFNVLFWAVTIVDCPRDISGVRLAVGSNSASIWWLNGKEVIDLYGDRHMLVDDGVSKRLALKKGKNVLRCAVINGPGLSDFCARFLDQEDKPLKSFNVSVSEKGK